MADNGVVVVEKDLVEAPGARQLPFTRTAETVGHKIVTNIVMLGFLGAMLDFIPHELLAEAVLAKVPPGTEDLNSRAVVAGRDLYLGNNE